VTPLFGDPLDEQAARWREALLETVRPAVAAKLPLLLSAGLDSGSILAACLDLGHHPHCYSYVLNWSVEEGGELSRDYVFSRRLSTRFHCSFTGIWIPRNLEQLESDVREVIGILRTARKTSVQCCQPMMHIARQLQKDGETRVLAGTGGIVLDGREVMVTRAEEGEEAARKLRAEKLRDRDNLDTATGQMHRMAKHFGVDLVEPYSEEPLEGVGLSIDLRDMNAGPKGMGAKGIAVRAFPDFWTQPGLYRRPSPLQVNGGVREWHEELLTSPLNPNGAERVVAVYNRILKETNEPHLLDPAGP
jgi:asparagine synthetase B (glutamine-hydrolysing)